MGKEAELSEKTRVPLGVVVGAFILIIPLIAWALRVEWSVSTKVDREQYISDMVELKKDVKDLKRHFKVRE